MPEYTALASAYLLVAAAAAVRLGLHRNRAAWLTLGIFLVATVVFDGLIVSAGIVTYGPWARSGADVGAAPIEDLAFGAALCLTALTTWTATGRPARR